MGGMMNILEEFLEVTDILYENGMLDERLRMIASDKGLSPENSIIINAEGDYIRLEYLIIGRLAGKMDYSRLGQRLLLGRNEQIVDGITILLIIIEGTKIIK